MKSKYARKTDLNQRRIVQGLRARNYSVEIIGEPLDLIASTRFGFWQMMEIKRPNKSIQKEQLEFIAGTKGNVQIITSEAEAIQFMNNPNKYRISQEQKDLLAGWLALNRDQKTLGVGKFRKLFGGNFNE